MLRVWILAVGLLAAGAGTSVHPYVRTLERYRAAREAHDVQALREIFSEDSRIWFDEKTGEGTRRTLEGRGRWSDWDEFFHSESATLATVVQRHSLRTTVREINDWYRLVERPASMYYITYDFDADGRITGTLIHSIPGLVVPQPRDRLKEFEDWARATQPGLLDELLPDGEIDPTKPALWKEKLLQWREATGQPNPLADSR